MSSLLPIFLAAQEGGAQSWFWSCSWPCPLIRWAHLLLVQWAPSIDGRWRVAAAVAGRGGVSLWWRMWRNRRWRARGGGVLGCWRRRHVALAGWRSRGCGGGQRGAGAWSWMRCTRAVRWCRAGRADAAPPLAMCSSQQVGSGWATGAGRVRGRWI
jgi:hypothetical protein